jgi:hypothetical protein
MKQFCMLPVSGWFLAWLIIRAWKWRRLVPPKHRSTFKWLYGIIYQETEFSISECASSSDSGIDTYVVYRKWSDFVFSTRWKQNHEIEGRVEHIGVSFRKAGCSRYDVHQICFTRNSKVFQREKHDLNINLRANIKSQPYKLKAEKEDGRRLILMREGQKKTLLMITEDPTTLNH